MGFGSVGDTFRASCTAGTHAGSSKYWFVERTPSDTHSAKPYTPLSLFLPLSLSSAHGVRFTRVHTNTMLRCVHRLSSPLRVAYACVHAFLSFPPSYGRGSKTPLRAHPVGHTSGWLHPLGGSGPKRQTRIERGCARRGRRKEGRSLSNLYRGLCTLWFRVSWLCRILIAACIRAA